MKPSKELREAELLKNVHESARLKNWLLAEASVAVVLALFIGGAIFFNLYAW